MKDYLEKRREELRKESGFTLMEMLIVVAIIAILIAIAIPVFSQQLERARESADAANIRAAYAEAMNDYIAQSGSGWNSTSMTATKTTEPMQSNGSWDYIEFPDYLGTVANATQGTAMDVTIAQDGTCSVTVTS